MYSYEVTKKLPDVLLILENQIEVAARRRRGVTAGPLDANGPELAESLTSQKWLML